MKLSAVVRLFSAVAAVAFAAAMLVSCGASETAVERAQVLSASTPEVRGTLRVSHNLAWGGDELLDPSSTAPLTWATTLLYDGLVRQDVEGQVVPWLATEWISNDAATEWKFTLRTDVVFHDGSPLDANDVKFTFDRIARSETSPIAGSLASVKRIEVFDRNVVNFVLAEPAVDFPLLFSDRRMRILSSESSIDVGTGPFRINAFDPKNTTLFVAHDDYFMGTPQLAAVEIVAMPDAVGRVAAVEAGRLDLVGDLARTSVEFLQGRPQFKVQSVPSGDWRGLVFDTRLEPYNDTRVIKALKLLIDREEMIELVAGGTDGAVISCDSPVWSNDTYHSAATCPPDIEQARDLLAQAGYPDGLDITITTSPLYSDWISLAEVFQYQAAQAGVRVTVDVVDASGFWSDVWMHEPATTTNWTQRTAEQILTEAFLSDAPWNESRWNNPAFDELVRAAISEIDDDRRADIYDQAISLIREEGGTIIPYHVKRSRVVGARVHGIEDGVERFSVPWHDVSVSAN